MDQIKLKQTKRRLSTTVIIDFVFRCCSIQFVRSFAGSLHILQQYNTLVLIFALILSLNLRHHLFGFCLLFAACLPTSSCFFCLFVFSSSISSIGMSALYTLFMLCYAVYSLHGCAEDVRALVLFIYLHTDASNEWFLVVRYGIYTYYYNGN